MPAHPIARSLLLPRLGVFIVMFVRTLDKLANPEPSGRVFERFYGIGGAALIPPRVSRV